MGTLEAPPALPTATWRLPRLGSVDAVGLEAHAAAVAGRAVEGDAERAALGLAVRVLDLLPADGASTNGVSVELCGRALRPDRRRPWAGPVASVSVPPALVPACRARLEGTSVRVAATCSSPSDLAGAARLGADELTLTLDHGAFLTGGHRSVFAELARARHRFPDLALRAVVDAGLLGGYDALRQAALLATAAGADAVAVTSAVSPLAAALCLLEAAADVHDQTGFAVGCELRDVRDADEAVGLLLLVHETLGPGWLTPERLRLGGTERLLDDLVAARTACG